MIREVAFNLIYVSAVLMLGILGMILYSLQQADQIEQQQVLAGKALLEEKRGERHNSG